MVSFAVLVKTVCACTVLSCHRVAAFGPHSTTPPVVVVPPMMGSVLTYNPSKEEQRDATPGCGPHSIFNTVPMTIWPPIPPFATSKTIASPCLLPRLIMSWHNKTKANTPLPGTETSDWGGFGGIAVDYPANLKPYGYVPGENLFGAPYDWRYAADGLDEVGYFTRLKALVERVYNDTAANASRTGRSPRVTLMGHSQGTSVMHSFLLRMGPGWKDTYIKGMVALAPVYTGVALPMIATISGSGAIGDVTNPVLQARQSQIINQNGAVLLDSYLKIFFFSDTCSKDFR